MARARIILSNGKEENHPRHSEGDFMRLNDGRILFIYTRYNGESHKDSAPADLVKIYSSDNGDTWTAPETVLEASKYGVKNIMSVSMLRMLNGDIGLIFIVKALEAAWSRKIVIVRSSDEGETWSEAIECTPLHNDGKYCVNNSRVVRLASGRIIYPLSLHPGAKKEQIEGKRKVAATSHTCGTFMYSDDDGYTWKQASDYLYPPFTKTNAGIQEGEIIEIAPNILKCFFRTQMSYQYESLSFDGGDHWTVPQASIFTGPCSPITIRRNPYTDKIYAFWNPIPSYNGRESSKAQPSRSPFAMARVNSDVSKIRWIDYVEDDRTAGYAYTAPFFLNEHEVLLAYCGGRPVEDLDMLVRLKISKVNLNDPIEEEQK